MYDQPVEEVPQKLIAGFHILRMTFFAEDSTQLTLCDFKINQAEYPDDVIISQVERYPQLFQDIIVGHLDFC